MTGESGPAVSARRVEWCCLGENGGAASFDTAGFDTAGLGEAIRRALAELSTSLARYDAALTFEAEPLPVALQEGLEQYLLEAVTGAWLEGPPPGPLATRRLFVVCHSEHAVVAAAQRHNAQALWGVSLPRVAAMAWVDNAYLWWHEVLHLFDAKDCYNRFGIHKCPETRCVMQAAPTEASCAGRLFLCSKNLSRLRRFNG